MKLSDDLPILRYVNGCMAIQTALKTCACQKLLASDAGSNPQGLPIQISTSIHFSFLVSIIGCPASVSVINPLNSQFDFFRLTCAPCRDRFNRRDFTQTVNIVSDSSLAGLDVCHGSFHFFSFRQSPYPPAGRRPGNQIVIFFLLDAIRLAA